MRCENCNSKRLEWTTDVHTPRSVADGRLKSSESRLYRVNPMFVLNCVNCSERVSIIHADIVAEWLTKQGKFSFEEVK